MKPTTPGAPFALAISGAVVGYLLEVSLVASGRPAFTPPVTFVISLLAIAGLCVAFGWPIRQTLRGKRTDPLNPFRAMRVVLLAKASVLVGALLGGAAVGIVLHVLSRPVVAAGNDLLITVLSVVAAAATVVAGLVVERWCRVPPDDGEDDTRSLSLQGE